MVQIDESGAEPLDNPEHERFARIRARGDIKTDWEAYQIAYGCSRESAEDRAYVIANQLGIRRRLQWLQGQAAKGDVLTLREAQEGLTAAWRTPVGQIDENHPLAQEVERDRETGVVTKVKSVGKLPALELLAKMRGWLDGGAGKEPHIRLRVVASGTTVAAEVDVGGEG